MQLQNQRKFLPLYFNLLGGVKLFFFLEDNNERNLNFDFNAKKRFNSYYISYEIDNVNSEYEKKFENLIDEFFF